MKQAVAFSAWTFVIVLVMFVGLGSCSLEQDKAECTNQLVGLSPCLPYVSGEAKTPNLDCCTALKPVLDKSKKCICILIKDRDDPNLGIKINGTLAVSLPTACHSPSAYNVTQCIDLLHLAPNSPDAKEFEGLGPSGNSTMTTPVASGVSNTSSITSTQENSDGGWGKMKMMRTEILCVALSLSISPHLIFPVCR